MATRQRASLSRAPARRVTWTQVAAWRVTRHHLDARVPRRRMLSVVSELCGLHAQVMSSAELMLWARVDGVRRDSLGTALWRDRTLVKMWAMRGTLHVFRSSEHPLWQAALSTYAHFPNRSWARPSGLPPTSEARWSSPGTRDDGDRPARRVASRARAEEATMTDRDAIDVGEPEESDLAEETMTTPPQEVREEVPDDERAEEELEPLDSNADQIEGADDEERPHDPQGPHFDE